jgi:hypothetical protein
VMRETHGSIRRLIRNLRRQEEAAQPKPKYDIAAVRKRLLRHAEACEMCEPGHSDYYSKAFGGWQVQMMIEDLAAMGSEMAQRSAVNIDAKPD